MGDQGLEKQNNLEIAHPVCRLHPPGIMLMETVCSPVVSSTTGGRIRVKRSPMELPEAVPARSFMPGSRLKRARNAVPVHIHRDPRPEVS